jgi:hypothetical protein
MDMSLKKYLLITIPIIAIVIFAVLAYANFGGIGDTLSGVGGPFANGFYTLLTGPLLWGANGGWPTLAIFYLIGFILVPFGLAYFVWHYDLPYKISGASQPSPASNYDNSMQREPAEPERSNQPSTTTTK